jgi:aspartate/methionine/tyrosine aminotransferase
MSFRKIDYLTWAREFMGRVKYDLAKSNILALSKEELRLTLDDLEINGSHEHGCDALYEHLANRYQVDRSCVYVCNGATQGIFLVCAAVLDRGDEVLLEVPNYEPLYRVPNQMGAEIKPIERRFERAFQIEMEEIERKVSKATRAFVFTNLHNPSGAATNAEKVETLGQILRDHRGYGIVSEVYLDASLSEGVKPAAMCGRNLISIGSLSKVYGLGGVRGGWIIADEEVIRRVKIVADYISGGHAYPSQTIMLLALRDAARLLQRTKDITARNFKIVADWVAKRPDLSWVKPDGGTVALIRIPHGLNAMSLSNRLREKHSTLVVPGDFFWMRGFVRVSCGIPEETLKAGLKNLASVIDEMQSSKLR